LYFRALDDIQIPEAKWAGLLAVSLAQLLKQRGILESGGDFSNPRFKTYVEILLGYFFIE